MLAPIWLKFGTPIGGQNVNISIKFEVNLINIQRDNYNRFYTQSKAKLPSCLQAKRLRVPS